VPDTNKGKHSINCLTNRVTVKFPCAWHQNWLHFRNGESIGDLYIIIIFLNIHILLYLQLCSLANR